ncbi:MAG: Ig-like domain-containing protein [Sandaracinaceae bacterium]
MPTRHSSSYARLVSIALGLVTASVMAGCDDDPGVIINPDASPELDSGTPQDGGPPADEDPPFVESTTPSEGTSGVEGATDVTVVFSETMADETDVTLLVEAAEVASSAAFAGDERTLTITPGAPFASGVEVLVTVGTGHRDASGNPLSQPYTFRFRVADEEAPTVTDSTPAEGAADVSRRFERVELTFSEAMNNAAGTLTLAGGPGEVENVRWSANDTVVAELTGLASATDYALALTGFEDAGGNALAGDTLGGDATLDFSTRVDDERPWVLDSNPAEGQVNIRVRSTPEVVVAFDEPMDTSIRTVTLSVEGADTAVEGSWDAAATMFTIPVGGQLIDDRPHQIDLSNLADPEGNLLDPAPYLGDGVLDFRTGADSAAPRVLYTAPVEGSSDARFTQNEVFIVFDKAMDDSVTSLTVDDGVAPFEAPVTWNLSATRATLDVTDRLFSGQAYRIVLAGLEDTSGRPVDVADVYLGDGALDFTMGTPGGESCRDALTVAEATSSDGGVFVFELPERTFALNDGSMSCDADGIVADGVIRYTKTTQDTAGGGTVLVVRADSNQLNVREGLDVEIFRDSCDPTAAGADAARETCRFSSRYSEHYLDVGPGDYYIWVAHNDDQFEDATITIEEVALPPEGETCLNPFTTGSPAEFYTPPAALGEPHTFTIPGDTSTFGMVGADMGVPMSCDDDGEQGSDAVIRFDKASATSVLRVTVDSQSGINGYGYEVFDVCDPTSAAATSLACGAGLSRSADPELFIEGPAGAYYTWFTTSQFEGSFSDGLVTFTEIEPAEGSSCARARPLTVGAAATFPISPDVAQRISPPSCGEIEDQYTWYRFTSPEVATVLRTDAAANFAVWEGGGTNRELGCQEGDDEPMFATTFLAPGTEICVGVQTGSSVTSLSIEPVEYDGIRGNVTDLNIDRPLTSSGSERSITTMNWMAVTDTVIYAGISSTGVLIAPRTGNARADFNDTPTSSQLGTGGASFGEALFALDDSTSSSTRLNRFVDGTGAFAITPWDTGTVWPSDGFDALTFDGTTLIAVNDYSSSVPTTFLSFDPSTPGPAVDLGSNPTLQSSAGLAADATWFYVQARDGGFGTAEGVFRVSRADPSVYEMLAEFDTSTRGAVVLDPTGGYLYVRPNDGHIRVIKDPGGASPIYLGVLSELGDGSDDSGMAWDPVENALVVFDSETVSTGRFVRMN